MKLSILNILISFSLIFLCFSNFCDAKGLGLYRKVPLNYFRCISDTIPPDVEKDTVDGEVFLKPTKEATFRGKRGRWEQYFKSKMSTQSEYLADMGPGRCVIGFVIDENGDVKDIKAVEMTSPAIAKVVIDIIKDSPKWEPAEINGEKIRSYKVQPFSIGVFREEKTERRAGPPGRRSRN